MLLPRHPALLIRALSALFLLQLMGCAVGPLVSHETARTVGQSRNEFRGGYGTAGYALKWNFGIRVKYAFINPTEGWAFAVAGGAGDSVGGSHYYGDLLASHFSGSWEPYGTLRFVRVKTDPWEFGQEDTGNIHFVVDSERYTYGQFILGTRYWMNDHMSFSVEASTLFAVSNALSVGSNATLAAGIGYRF
jgi:hypothetical protein